MRNLSRTNLKAGIFISYYSSSGILKILRMDHYFIHLGFKTWVISEFWKSPNREFRDFYTEGQSWFPSKFRQSRINEIFSFTQARINYRHANRQYNGG